jgi:hypothetical protein
MTLSFQKEHETLIQTGVKIHTLRDGKTEWYAGMTIHYYTNMYRKGMCKFHPDQKAISVQEVYMTFFNGRLEITIDDKYIYNPTIEMLALNDGFASVEKFTEYFFPSYSARNTWSGQLIHWTDLKY